ncbi:hypothetical protein CDO87_03435 [Sagittula sp. P11]|uniref:hypothetical protein n=1 Tax=Sagittula sp. P11 TaxID=2009329 RepID=UPI000C2D5998|nr:hypothetical protein [Sagittula sp. P11]AUC52298.1 hypothetical protein CDO87_03435 [Sagittula sp. P11]
MNKFLARLRTKRTFNTAEAGGGGGAGADLLNGGGTGTPPAGGTGTPPAGGTGTPQAGGTGTPPAGGTGTPPAGGTGTAPAGGTGTPWWGDTRRFDEGTRTMLQAKGLTVDDPLEAMGKLAGLYTHAEKRLGRPADTLMDRPKDGQDLTEWMKGNADVFGIPESADGYDLKRPDTWPKDAPWDDKAEATLKQRAHELGMTPTAAQAMVDLYAGTVAETLGGAEQRLDQAKAELKAELTKDWGDAYAAKVSGAQQAFHAVAEQAGLPADAIANFAEVLSEKAGDANALRIFAALGDMMGEDVLPRDGSNKGGFSTTPAEARAELARFDAPDSEYGKAVQARRNGQTPANWAELTARRQHLIKLAAGT